MEEKKIVLYSDRAKYYTVLEIHILHILIVMKNDNFFFKLRS